MVQGGGSNDSDLEDAGAILESPGTPGTVQPLYFKAIDTDWREGGVV